MLLRVCAAPALATIDVHLTMLIGEALHLALHVRPRCFRASVPLVRTKSYNSSAGRTGKMARTHGAAATRRRSVRPRDRRHLGPREHTTEGCRRIAEMRLPLNGSAGAHLLVRHGTAGSAAVQTEGTPHDRDLSLEFPALGSRPAASIQRRWLSLSTPSAKAHSSTALERIREAE